MNIKLITSTTENANIQADIVDFISAIFIFFAVKKKTQTKKTPTFVVIVYSSVLQGSKNFFNDFIIYVFLTTTLEPKTRKTILITGVQLFFKTSRDIQGK